MRPLSFGTGRFRTQHLAKTGMLIRKPVPDVFKAFINPAITTKFWFTKSSGRLEAGRQVKWEWEMYGSTTNRVADRFPKGPKEPCPDH